MIEYSSLKEYFIIFWRGDLEDDKMMFYSYEETTRFDPLEFHRLILYNQLLVFIQDISKQHRSNI